MAARRGDGGSCGGLLHAGARGGSGGTARGRRELLRLREWRRALVRSGAEVAGVGGSGGAKGFHGAPTKFHGDFFRRRVWVSLSLIGKLVAPLLSA